MDTLTNVTVEELAEPVTYPVEAFVSPEYARAEADRLWAKVWQHAGRVEEIPEVGDYITYEIGDDSIIIVRNAPDSIKAYHNVCPHRGRRLINAANGKNGACGKKRAFVCGFHGWTYDLNGKNTYILDKDDWKGVLQRSALRSRGQGRQLGRLDFRQHGSAGGAAA